MNNKYRKCNNCHISKSLDCFYSKQNKCKDCFLKKEKQDYTENKVLLRIPLRDEFRKRCYEEGGMALEDFNRVFVPFEKYDEMKKQTDLYSFCECSKMKEDDRLCNAYEYDEKRWWLDIVMCHNIKRNSGYIIHII